MPSNLILRVIELAVTAPSADNAQPWRFFQEDGKWHCTYHHNGKNDVFGTSGHATLLSTGALSFNLDLICGKSNTSSAVDANGNWHLSFTIPQEIDGAVEAYLRRRHTNRHPFSGTFAPPDYQLTELIDQIKIQFVTDTSAIQQLSESVRLCSEVRFNNQELHEWLFSSLRWTPSEVANGDGLDIQTLHLPLGGSAFMKFLSPWKRMRRLNSIGIYKLMAKLDSNPVRQAPALIALTGPQDPKSIWQTGRLLAQLWCLLNRDEISVHPYYVLTDIANRLRINKLPQAWVEQASFAMSIASNALQMQQQQESIHILLRVGTPTVSPVLARRRAAETFLAYPLATESTKDLIGA